MVLFVDIEHENIHNTQNYSNTAEKCCDTLHQNNQSLCEKWQSIGNYYNLNCAQDNAYDGLNHLQTYNQQIIETEHFDGPSDRTTPCKIAANLTVTDKKFSNLKEFYEDFAFAEDVNSHESYNGSVHTECDILPDVPDEILDMFMESIVEISFLKYEDIAAILMFHERGEDLLCQPTSVVSENVSQLPEDTVNWNPTLNFESEFDIMDNYESTQPPQKYCKLTMHQSKIMNNNASKI